MKSIIISNKDKFISILRIGLVLILFSSLLPITNLSAQTIEQKPDLKFQRIHEGLTGNRVSAILQDHRGFMWIGTPRGLHLYDGIQFKIYTSGLDSTSINHNSIYTIFEDSKNRLWIGTGNGISRYNIDTDDFRRFELPYAIDDDVPVNSILEDENGRLWVSGGGSGLYHFDSKTEQFVPYMDFSDLTVNSMTGGQNDILWLATTESGVIKLNTQDKSTKFFTHEPDNSNSISSNSVEVVRIDQNGNLWAGTQGWGLNRLEYIDAEGVPHFIRYIHKPDTSGSLANNEISTIYIDINQNLWIGNINGGLHLYNETEDSFFHYDSDPQNNYSLTHNSIESIYQDSYGRYWIGTSLSGINMADPMESKFERYYNDPRNPNSLNNNIIRDFYENDDSSIWIATDGGGINLFDRARNRFTSFKHDPEDQNSLRSDAVISLNKDSQGNLWAGTWGGGANILIDEEGGKFTTFNRMFNIHDYPLHHVFDMHFDENYIWLAAFNEGLYRYDVSSGNIQLFNHNSEDPNSLSSNFLLRIFEDSNNNIWIATEVGLNKIKAENRETVTFQRYIHSPEEPNSIANVSVRQIYEDHQQNLWIATEGGLSKYVQEEDHFINFGHSDGLPSDEVNSIIEDDNGYLWIGTLKGISRFDPDDKSFTNFDQSHGLLSDEFSRYAVLKTQSGELLFGGMNGFNLFHPEDLHSNPHPPPVYLTDFRLFNRPVDLTDPESPLQTHIAATDTLVLTYQQNVFSFEFIALNYTRPEFNQYAYIMEGFEEDWNYVGSQRNATYTNLYPGEYTFRVKASNNDGVWNEDGASITLTITPPFWQTTWFYLLSTLFILGVILAVFSLRVRSIREHNKRLELEVSERTEELRQKNKTLQSTLKELESTKDALVEQAHKAGMADIATGVLHNVGNILTSINTSAALIENTARESKIYGFVKANNLLRQNIDRIEEFISDNPKGKSLMEYYLKLEEPLTSEQQKVLYQTERLIEKIKLVNEVIAAQQNYAGTKLRAEEVSVSDVVEHALTLQSGSIERHGLHIEKDLSANGNILVQRTKLIHVLVNIFKNAKEAMFGLPPEKKKITIKTWENKDRVFLSISDNGVGIKAEHLDKIFTQGFTTKRNGHGFGLHSSANYLHEMDGSIKVESEGQSKGATFTLSLVKVLESINQPEVITESETV